ncbi:MAG: hypothetical protein WBA46_03735 [Thermomicrobiales bacterium]
MQHANTSNRTRHAVVSAGIAVIGAAIVGALAGTMREDQFWVVFAVFAGTTLVPIFGLAWMATATWLGDDSSMMEPSPDSIEHEWTKDAAVAALRDVIVVLTVASVLTAVFDIGHVPAYVFLVVAMVDWFGRTLLLERRDS